MALSIKGFAGWLQHVGLDLLGERIADVWWRRIPDEVKQEAKDRLGRLKKIAEWRNEWLAYLQRFGPDVWRRWQAIFRRYASKDRENPLVERMVELYKALDGTDDPQELVTRDQLFEDVLPNMRPKEFDEFVERLTNDWFVEAIKRYGKLALGLLRAGDQRVAKTIRRLQRGFESQAERHPFWFNPFRLGGE